MQPDLIWEGDQLNRTEEALFLQNYIQNVFDTYARDTSFVLNINSEWGHGKTWFLERFCKQLNLNHPVVYFDAWKNDFTNDALLSFVSVICNDLKSQFEKEDKINNKLVEIRNSFKKIVKVSTPILTAFLAKQATGLSIDALTSSINGDLSEDASDAIEKITSVVTENLIDDFLEKRKGIDGFKAAIASLVDQIEQSPDTHLPICIIVDELDRCRPTYAIELLESIKHLFDVKGVFFVLATDTRQLSHSVKAVYGNDFSSIAYLKRFFSAEYQLAQPDYDKLASFLFKEFKFKDRLIMQESLKKNFTPEEFFGHASRYFKLTARDQYQVYDLLATCCLTSENAIFQFPYLLLLIILKHRFPEETYTLFSYPTLTNFEEALRNIQMKQGILEQKFTCVQWRGNQPNSGYSTFTELFRFYFTLADAGTNLSKFSRVSDAWDYQQQIATSLASKNNLRAYFLLITQAGRISKLEPKPNIE